MAFGEALASVRECDMELDDQVPIPRLVEGSARAFASLDDSQERERGELPFRVALLDVSPHRRALRGVLAQRKRVEEAEPPRIGEPLQRRRGAFVLLVARALKHGGVAREEV